MHSYSTSDQSIRSAAASATFSGAQYLDNYVIGHHHFPERTTLPEGQTACVNHSWREQRCFSNGENTVLVLQSNELCEYNTICMCFNWMNVNIFTYFGCFTWNAECLRAILSSSLSRSCTHSSYAVQYPAMHIRWLSIYSLSIVIYASVRRIGHGREFNRAHLSMHKQRKCMA